MSDLLVEWWQHQAALERFTGAGVAGDSYAAPATVLGFFDDEQKLVRAPDGQQVMSAGSFFLPAATADVPLKTRVTFSDPFAGRAPAVVIAVARHEGAGLPSHVELVLG